ncbi:hypothetical protein ACS0TY_021556 [Phlomoides rotata]
MSTGELLNVEPLEMKLPSCNYSGIDEVFNSLKEDTSSPSSEKESVVSREDKMENLAIY